MVDRLPNPLERRLLRMPPEQGGLLPLQVLVHLEEVPNLREQVVRQVADVADLKNSDRAGGSPAEVTCAELVSADPPRELDRYCQRGAVERLGPVFSSKCEARLSEAAPSTPSVSTPRAPIRLAELSWAEAASRFRRDPRLLLPVGTCLQHGPHLPLGADALIITRLGEAIAARYDLLVAPTIPYGAASATDTEYAGTASLSGKTLHRVLNELVSCWEAQGVEELVLLTGHGYGPHLYALATVVSESARIRSVDLHAIDLSAYLESAHTREHAGELATSLMLHLAPELVRTDRIQDVLLPPERVRKLVAGEEPVPLPGSIGVVGRPSIASAEKGRAIYEYLIDHIGRGLFGPPAPPDVTHPSARSHVTPAPARHVGGGKPHDD